MPSAHEAFWNHDSYALVGHSADKPFPLLSYRALKALGKTVYAVDASTETVDGDPAFDDFEQLPTQVDAVVLEVPREQTARWMALVADRGVQRVWIHMKRDTPEALALAEKHGIQVCTGTCAVQYLRGGFPHSVHRMLRKLSGKW